MLRIVKVMFPRPKSCYKRSAGEPKIRQRSVDLTTGTPSTISTRTSPSTPSSTGPLDATMLLSKRSNSLQNLSSVRCKERRVDFRHPVKLAWTQKAHSQDSDYESQFTAPNDQLLDEAGEWCDTKGSDSTQQEQQKRKSLDIFLARSFIDPADLLSGDVNRRHKALVKPFASLSEVGSSAATFDDELISDNIWSQEEENSTPPPAPINSSRGEKRVTFAGEVHFEPRKLSAETRRMNFRNSRTNFKIHYNPSTSSDSFGPQNSITLPEPATSNSQSLRQWTSFSSSVDNDLDVERSTCPSPAVSSSPAPVTVSRLSSTSPTPSMTVKRKLKSCRSRSFHKSFDGNTSIGNVETYCYVKATKPNPADVVTVVSLLTSSEEMETEMVVGHSGKVETKTVPVTAPVSVSVSVVTDTKDVSDKLIKPQVREIRTKSGILKVKPRLSKSISLVEPLPAKPMVLTSEKLTSTPDFRPLCENNVSRLENVTVTSSNHVAAEKSNFSTSVEILDCTTQSQKEQECWSSFNKMTNKGLFVSFDTILRGLLTPTEYRLRKSELLKQN